MKPNLSTNDMPRTNLQKQKAFDKLGFNMSMNDFPMISQQIKNRSFKIQSKKLKSQTKESF